MKVGELCRRSAISISDDADVGAAALLMREQHVGFLVVHRRNDDSRHPIGVVTDRDVVLEVIAAKVDPTSVTVGDVMSRQPLIASETDDLSEVLQAMRIAGIRRVPVVDARGALVGVFAMDDALDIVTGLLCDMTGSVKNEQRQERRARSA